MSTAANKSNGSKENKEALPLPSLEEFAQALGIEIDKEALKRAESKVTVEVVGGEVTQEEFKALVAAKILEYYPGVVYELQRLHAEQIETKNKKRDKNPLPLTMSRTQLAFFLRELAIKEVKFGIRPIEHCIPLDGTVYVNIEGRKFYAASQGKRFTVEYQILSQDERTSKYEIRCIVTVNDGTKYEGYGIASSDTLNYRTLKYARKMAQKRALADALSIAFPIGTAFEEAEINAEFVEARQEEGDPLDKQPSNNYKLKAPQKSAPTIQEQNETPAKSKVLANDVTQLIGARG